MTSGQLHTHQLPGDTYPGWGWGTEWTLSQTQSGGSKGLLPEGRPPSGSRGCPFPGGPRDSPHGRLTDVSYHWQQGSSPRVPDTNHSTRFNAYSCHQSSPLHPHSQAIPTQHRSGHRLRSHSGKHGHAPCLPGLKMDTAHRAWLLQSPSCQSLKKA